MVSPTKLPVSFFLISTILTCWFTQDAASDPVYTHSHADHEGHVPEGIIGGKRAEKGQFPWMVWVHNKERKTQCGASIISSSNLITAAHCVLNKGRNGLVDPKMLDVYAGLTNIDSRFERDVQKSGVQQIMTHRKYIMQSSIYEIAVLKLTKKFIWTNFVKPIRWGNEKDRVNFVGVEMVASGWGTIDIFGPEGKGTKDLLYATLVGTECTHPSEGEDVFCGIGRKRENVCSGDSGGPIVCKDRVGKDYLCGFSSKSACDKGYGVLGRVNFYTDFIRQSLKV